MNIEEIINNYTDENEKINFIVLQLNNDLINLSKNEINLISNLYTFLSKKKHKRSNLFKKIAHKYYTYKKEIENTIENTIENEEENEENEIENEENIKDGLTKNQRIYSYIILRRIIKKIKDYIMNDKKEREKKEKMVEDEAAMFKKATYDKHLFCTLKNKNLSDKIKNPTPMPVTVAKYEELEPFFTFLKEHNIVDWNLEDIKINVNDVELNSDHLKFKRGIVYKDGRMDLCKQVVGPDHIESLLNSIKKNKHIKHFLLGNNIISDIGAKAISDFILDPENIKIETWYLAGNCLSAKGIEMLSNALSNDNNVKELWLKRNPIHSEGAEHISKMILKNNSIEVLDLDNTAIMDLGIKYIFESLKYNNSIKHLYINSCGISHEGLTYITDYLKYKNDNNLDGIECLYLEINRIYSEENKEIFYKFCDEIKKNKSIKKLAIGSNRIDDDGFIYLLNSLMNKEIQVLDVGVYKSTYDLNELPNNFTTKSVPVLIDFMTNNKFIEVLDISKCGYNLEDIHNILNGYLNSSILYIIYEQYFDSFEKGIRMPNDIKNKFLEKMTDNINKKYNISYTDFVKNKLRYIKHNNTITHIDSLYRNNDK